MSPTAHALISVNVWTFSPLPRVRHYSVMCLYLPLAAAVAHFCSSSSSNSTIQWRCSCSASTTTQHAHRPATSHVSYRGVLLRARRLPCTPSTYVRGVTTELAIPFHLSVDVERVFNSSLFRLPNERRPASQPARPRRCSDSTSATGWSLLSSRRRRQATRARRRPRPT